LRKQKKGKKRRKKKKKKKKKSGRGLLKKLFDAAVSPNLAGKEGGLEEGVKPAGP